MKLTLYEIKNNFLPCPSSQEDLVSKRPNQVQRRNLIWREKLNLPPPLWTRRATRVNSVFFFVCSRRRKKKTIAKKTIVSIYIRIYHNNAIPQYTREYLDILRPIYTTIVKTMLKQCFSYNSVDG